MKPNTYLILAVLTMFAVTYLTRVVPLLLLRRKITNIFMLRFLAYIPYAVLSSLTIPAIFTSTASSGGAVCGFLLALYLAYREKSLLMVAVAAATLVYLVETLLSLTF